MLDRRCQSIIQESTNGCVHVCNAIVFGTRITLCIHRDCFSRIMNRGVAQDTIRRLTFERFHSFQVPFCDNPRVSVGMPCLCPYNVPRERINTDMHCNAILSGFVVLVHCPALIHTRPDELPSLIFAHLTPSYCLWLNRVEYLENNLSSAMLRMLRINNVKYSTLSRKCRSFGEGEVPASLRPFPEKLVSVP